MRKLSVLSGMVCLILGAATAHAITVVRSVAGPCVGGTDLSITLKVLADNGAPPRGVLLTETFPAGWTLDQSAIVPGAFDEATNTAGWLFAQPQSNDAGELVSLTYTLHPDASASGSVSLSGRAQISYSGSIDTPPIGGVNSVSCVPAPIVATRTLPPSCNGGKPVAARVQVGPRPGSALTGPFSV